MPATPPPPGSVEDELARDVQAQALHLRRLSQRLDQLSAEYDELRQHLDQITQLAADLQHVLDKPPAAEGPPCWPTMTDLQAAHAWETLARWIEEVFVPWYDITREQLPDCWALHRPVVSELSWLQHTHHAAYQPGAAPHLAAEWHSHWKPAALRRIRDAVPRRGHRACSPGHNLATDTERTPHPPTRPPTRPAVAPRTPLTEQLATREHWHDFHQQATADDLTARRCRSAGN